MDSISVGDALDVFGLEAGFSMPELKKAYRELSLRVHPDRGGSDELFRTVNDCFGVLSLEHNSRSGGAMHDQLKRDFDADVARHDAVTRSETGFNIETFNSVFSATRARDDVVDSGYGEWLRAGIKGVAPQVDPKGGVEAFNRAFERSVPPPVVDNSTAMVVRPIDAGCGSHLWLTELGVDAVDDYSMGGAFDCRIAHSTQRLAGASSDRHGTVPVPAQVEAMRARDMERGLSDAEREALAGDERRQRHLDSVRREAECARNSRFVSAHARARALFLGC